MAVAQKALTGNMNTMMMKNIVFIVGHQVMEVVRIALMVNTNMVQVVTNVGIVVPLLQAHVRKALMANMKNN